MADQTSETAKRPHVEAESESIVEPTNGHASKKPKLDQVGHMNNTTDEHTGVITSFGEFRTTKVLNEDSQWKSMVLLGRFGKSDKDAVVILNKTPLSEELAKEMLTETSVLRNIMQNDIYGTYELLPKQELNALKTTLIYPATEKHIAKYSTQQSFLITETADDYAQITLPCMESEHFSLGWVYNILNKKSEADRVIYEDPNAEEGFIVLPDLKWNGKVTEDLYVMAVVHKRGIRSLRDLTAVHLSMLKNILAKGKAAIWEHYQVPETKLRIYVHYLPSYYHFHVHFTHLNYVAPGCGVERAHLLTDIINNLEIDSSYYMRSTLSFVVRENDKLCALFQEAGRI